MIFTMLLLTFTLALPLANGGGSNKRSGIGGFLPIPDDLIHPPNQSPSVPSNALSGSDIPKNLIIAPSCSTGCPPIVGTNKDDIIYAVGTTDVNVFALNGDDVLDGGGGNSKLYGGNGNDLINGGSGSAQMYGGNGNDVLIGGTGVNLMIGGSGNDQLYAGTAGDTLIGGPGADYFNCGTQTGTSGSGMSAVILDFDPGEGDTKASNCKYVITQPGAPAGP